MTTPEPVPPHGERPLSELAVELLLEHLVRQSLTEIDVRHVVVVRDSRTGAITVQGPYRDGLAALVAADLEAESDRADGGRLEFSVTPLIPGDDPPPA